MVLPGFLTGPELEAAQGDLALVYSTPEEYHSDPLSDRNDIYAGDEFGASSRSHSRRRHSATLIDAYPKFACWFCEPHSQWQCGQVETLNRQCSGGFPCGTELAEINPAYADEATAIVNGRSPTELYAALALQ